LVGHSFGGLIIKSLVVEVTRCMNQKTSNGMELAMNARSKYFYDNLTGVIFYGAPHEGGTKTFSTYFAQICQEMVFEQDPFNNTTKLTLKCSIFRSKNGTTFNGV